VNIKDVVVVIIVKATSPLAWRDSEDLLMAFSQLSFV
jgi:hypothetical protein